jgi:tetratricopeptide (TPR) repeat protein
MTPQNWNPRPPARVGAPVELYTLDDRTFERLCSELLEREPDLESCDIFGTPGQGQFGIDLIARELNGIHIQVGQCKCYREFSVKDIKDASAAFLDHWNDRWATRGVTTFVLFVACEVDETQKQDEIDRQRSIFAGYSIKYELWPATRILKKLRPHRGIVSTYFHPPEYWVAAICGDIVGYPPSLTSAVIYQNEQLSTVLAGAVETSIVSIREAWQEGRRSDARRMLLEVRANDVAFRLLPSPLQAKLIRFSAVDILEAGGDLFEAERLVQEAAAVDASGPGTAQLAAIIRVRKRDLAGALDLLVAVMDPDTIHLKASILLALDRAPEAVALLSTITDAQQTAETHRIRALIALFAGDMPSALLSVQKAMEAQPLWPNVLFLYAALQYLSGLAITPQILPGRPEPPPWDLVRRDDQTLQRFTQAATLFQRLSQSPDVTSDERDTLEVWRLACLANHPGTQDEASSFCRKLLKDEPTRPEPVAWAIVRGLDVNLARSEAYLKDVVNNGNAHPDQIISLVAIYCHRKQWLKAERVLDRHHTVFTEDGQQIVWVHWKAQVLAFEDRGTEAVSLLDTHHDQDELLSLRTKIVAALPNADEARQQSLAHCLDRYTKTNEARYLIDACRLAEALRDWAFIAERAMQILHAVGTAELVRPLAGAAFNASRPETCLAVLDQSAQMFPGGKLPNDLRRLRIACQQRLGAIPTAMTEAERLVQDDPTLQHLIDLAQISFSKADFRRLVLVSREILKQPDLDSNTALQLSWQTQWEDQRLSRELWLRATTLGIPDTSVMYALRLAYALRLDHEVGPLTKRMEELGQQNLAGIQMASLDQLIEYTRTFQQHAAELNRLYTNAQIPVHFVAAQVNLSLADLYHGNIEHCVSSEDLSTQSALLVRYGGRNIGEDVRSRADGWQLHMDITALLLAADLDLLPVIESHYKPIRISRHIVKSLVVMRDHLTLHQPTRVAAATEIVSLRGDGRLGVVDPSASKVAPPDGLPPGLRGDWAGLLNVARSSGGYLIDFVPIPSAADCVLPSSLPPDVEQRLSSCRSVIEALKVHGPYSDEEYTAAMRRLGSEAENAILHIPNPDDRLYFQGTTVELLSASGALRVTCDRFRCYITRQESERLDAELKLAEAQHLLGEWVATLVDRVSRGIDDGVYEIILGTEPTRRDDDPHNIDTACLVSLLDVSPESNSVLWIDDRWANRHLRGGSVPIVDVFDVLQALRAKGVLSETHYFGKLSRLRSGNVWFIPTECSEILWHLRRASVGTEGLVETLGLKALRRGTASCLLRSNILQKPTDEQVSSRIFEEGSFILSFHHALTDAITDVWRSGDTLDIRTAQSDWLLHSMYVDPHVLKRLIGVPSDTADAVSLTANRFALLLSRAFSMSLTGPGRERTKEYVRWLVDRVLAGPLKNEPGLAARTADVIKRIFLDIAPRRLRTKREKTIAYLLHENLRLLPAQIQDEITRDPELVTRLKLESTIVVDISGRRFERSCFLRAAHAAINGKEQSLSDIVGETAYTLMPCDPPTSCSFRIVRNADPADTITLDNPFFGILSDSPTVREDFLRVQHHLFDMAASDFSGFVAEVASTEDPDRRMRKAEEERANSGVYYYQQLYEKVRKNLGFDRGDFFPADITPLVRHYRLSPEYAGATSVAFAEGAQTLLESEDLENAILRFVRLPIPLPQIIRDGVARLSEDEREALFERLLPVTTSPLSSWHMISMLRTANNPDHVELAEDMAAEALTVEATEGFEAYRSVLVWCAQELRVWSPSDTLSDGFRLALTWAHAHQVFVFFKAAGAPMEWVRGCFEHFGNRVRFGPVEIGTRLRADVSHPVHLSREVFLLSGLQYAYEPSEAQPLPTRLSQAFWTIAVTDTEIGPIPALPLLLDSTMVLDQLGSLLGGNRRSKLVSLTPEEHRGLVEAVLAESTLQTTLDQLEAHTTEVVWWSRLYTVLGETLVPTNYRETLSRIILKTDFAAATKANAKVGSLALHIAGTYAKHMTDVSVRQHLTDALYTTGMVLQKAGEEFDIDRRVQLLIEIALNIAQCSPPNGRIMDEFASILSTLCRTWPAVSELARPLVQRLCEEAPLAESEALWRLNLNLRCRP